MSTALLAGIGFLLAGVFIADGPRWIARKLIGAALRQLPPAKRERYRSEWLYDVENTNALKAVFWALGIYATAYALGRDFGTPAVSSRVKQAVGALLPKDRTTWRRGILATVLLTLGGVVVGACMVALVEAFTWLHKTFSGSTGMPLLIAAFVLVLVGSAALALAASEKRREEREKKR